MRAARIFLPVIALLLCCAFVLPHEREPKPDAPEKYFEIVVHAPDCKGNECFTEYIFLSDGIAIRKLPVTGKAQGQQIQVKQADEKSTAALFEQVLKFFTNKPPSNPGTAQDQLFYYDGEKYFAYNAFTPAPAELNLIFEESGKAFDAGAAAEDFFLHTYWQPLKGGTKDLHVFADGTVITSMFVRQTSSIMYTSMSQLKDGDLEKIRALAAASAAAPQKGYVKCPRETGLDYGFVEFQSAGAYARSFACGEVGNLFSPLFTYMRDNYGDAK